MKELSIEEKAKRYDEAVETARKINSGEGVATPSGWTVCEVIFPTLRESEDDRIRKYLIDVVNDYCKGSEHDGCIAWLEKQGEHADFRNKIQIGDKVTRNEDGVLVNLSQLKRVAKHAEEYNIIGIGSKNAQGKLGEMIKRKLEMEKQGEQKPDNWEPQTGDTFRKKGTISPTYHLCNKREDGITFGFVENREVGIAGGEITIFALKSDYELVERPKSIEDVVEEELNKGLQAKVGQNIVWSEEQIKKDLNKAANEWECKASFSPIAMVMDGDRPIGTKQHITSHADSFKAGVEWVIKKLKGENV